jgi:multidrug efflux pump subunit AcrA (membrane-fusion protein)
MNHLAAILFGVLLTALGLVVGRGLASSGTSPGAAEEEASAPHGAEDEGRLSPQTLRGLGVVVEPVRREEFLRTRPVQAVVVARPLGSRPVTAPLGGIVVGLDVDVGHLVRPGAVLATIARDPIPRPKPELTAEVLTPLNESVHDISARLRTAAGHVELTRRELGRIQPFLQDHTIPLKTEIDLRYELERQEKEVANASADLALHGLTGEEIALVESGGAPPASRRLWQRVLEQNGLWTDQSEAIHAELTKGPCLCDLPWCVTAIGELTSTGLATDALVDALRESEPMRIHFPDVAGLLLDGMPLQTVRTLAEGGALEPRIVLRAPDGAAIGWDVETVPVRRGQRVEPGDVLVDLHDAQRMWLRLQPVGAEIPLVVRAVEEGTPLLARPLVEGAGVVLKGVVLQRMLTHAGAEDRGGGAIAEVENRVLGSPGGDSLRSWALRVGLRYLVEVPIARMPDRFVLPFDAVTDHGPDRVVFLADGSTFRPQPVHVEYEDDRIVVIADDGSLFDGDPVVVHGAFALGLALKRGPAVADPHAGHSHN